ncbi:DNA repair protein RecO [bacterium 210917-SL.2.15]|nr:DNA repair protein RecO [bacterium 210917-SL.2.15]
MHRIVEGIVLRETETKEADKILTILTRTEGKLAVIARGARRRRSRIAAAAQLLVYSEMTLYQKGNWSILDEASTLELFDGVRRDVEFLALGSYFAELTELLTAEDVPSPEILSLLLNALYALGTLHREPEQVKAAFELRLLALSGFEPMLESCAVCGTGMPEEPMLDVVQGVLHCRRCALEGRRGLSMPLCFSSLAAMRHVLRCAPKRLYAFSLPPDALRRMEDASEAFAAAQLERGFRTLDFYKRIRIKETIQMTDTERNNGG